MPELPEVETVMRGLATQLEGKRIERVEPMREGLRFPFPERLVELLEGQRIVLLARRSKYILCELENGWQLLLHLGMSGKILVYPEPRQELKKHDHLLIWLEGGTEIAFNDARRFGIVDLIKPKQIASHPLLSHLGPEPLENEFTPAYLYAALKKRSMAIKPALMDAKLVVGVGNIYASEALFKAGIAPVKKANTISKKQCEILVTCIQEVLRDAIRSGGSTLRDYVRSSGDVGYFQHQFKVYGREKEPCLICSSSIERIVQTGRSSFYCPSCQK